VPHVGLVETRRPPNNYMNVPLLDGILAGISRLSDDGCRVVVLRSEGKHFSAGRDFSAPRLPGDTPEDMYQRAASLYESSLPVVAEIQGGAIGAGLGLAALADFRVAAPRAYFWANFVRLGSHPGFGLTATLPTLIGHRHAAWMFSTGERVNAETALGWGLVDQVVPEEELSATSLALAVQIAALPPEALAAVRATMRSSTSFEAFRAATRHEAAEQARLRRRAAASEPDAPDNLGGAHDKEKP
jgi:enoyl-CoA hydratase/carnithine racemase